MPTSAAACKVGAEGVEPTLSCSQSTRAADALHSDVCDDPNRRLPTVSTQRFSPQHRIHQQLRSRSSSYGNRTHISALKERDPQTARRTSRAFISASGSGGARILVSWSSARRYAVSATNPRMCSEMPTKKGPASLGHRAFKLWKYLGWLGVTSAGGAANYPR